MVWAIERVPGDGEEHEDYGKTLKGQADPERKVEVEGEIHVRDGKRVEDRSAFMRDGVAFG